MQLVTQLSRRDRARRYTPSHNPNTRTNFAASYVTGSHAFKAGVDFAWAERGFWTGSVVPYSYTVQHASQATAGSGIPVPTQLNLRSDGCQRSAGPHGERQADNAGDDVRSVEPLSDVPDRQDRRRRRLVRPGPVDHEPRHAEPRGCVSTSGIPASPVITCIRRSSRRTATTTCRRSRPCARRTSRRRWPPRGTFG